MAPARPRRARTRWGGALATAAPVAGVVVVIAGLIAAVAWIQGGGSSKPAATTSTTLDARQRRERSTTQAWSSEAEAAFGGTGLGDRVTMLVQGARDWMAGTLPTDQFKARLDDDLTAFGAIQVAVHRLRAYPYDHRVNDLYGRSAGLYVDTVRAYEVAVTEPPGDVRTQLDLLARRLRELGDRVFDRGQALVNPRLHQPPDPNVDVRLPEEVPNWVAEGLAAGPPLDAPPPPAAAQPRTRQATRPQQRRAAWLAAVTATAAPSIADVRAAIDAGDATRLGDVATRLIAAVERLRTVPDPTGDREESARLRLGYLVRADAARTAQLGAISATPALTDLARAVLVDADGLA